MNTRPFISVLLAVRNEEENIMSCLQALARLNYPAKKFEVLIGNDQSTDRTSVLIEEFIQDKPHFHLFTITQNLGQTQGKANVLAHLAQKAKGDLFFMTDADIEVSPDWFALQEHLTPTTGILTGFTTIEGNTIFHHLQALDWILALGMIQQCSQWGIPLTAMGNNMVVTRKAYQAVGGYENIPFSITEDFALFHQIIKKNFDFQSIAEASTLAVSKPISSLIALLHQRKRWMRGAMQLPLIFKTALFLHTLFLPLLLLFSFVFPYTALFIFSAKFFIQIVFLHFILRKIQRISLWKYIFIYEFYAGFFAILLISFYFLPIAIRWKDRSYK